MTVKASTVAVSGTAVLLAKGYGSKGSAVTFSGAGAFFVGGSDVTVADGFPIGANASVSIDLEYNEELYAVASAPVTVHVLTQGE